MSKFSHFCSNNFGYIFVIALFVAFHQGDARELCYADTSYYYCDYGCCGDKCCGMGILAIVGVTISSILVLVALVGCIVCLACMCKQSGHRGTVVQPLQHNTNAVYVHNLVHPPPGPPPGYGQYNTNPSNSNQACNSYNDSAYPPGVLQSGSHPPPAYAYSDPRSK